VRTDLQGVNLRLADLSHGRFEDSNLSMSSFERGSLADARFRNVCAEDANFEFCDLRQASLDASRFSRSNLVGAALDGARGTGCFFDSADFYWAELDGFTHFDCNFEGVRGPDNEKIAHHARGVIPPRVTPVPLYRKAVTDEECKKLLEVYFGVANNKA
jgi:uncharacterized protein YjbI with pentapeptide repeats